MRTRVCMWRRVQRLAWLIFGALLPIAASAQMSDDVRQKLESASVQIWLDNGRGTSRFAGSGVLLSSGVVITARHIFLDETSIRQRKLKGPAHADAANRRIYIHLGDDSNRIKVSEVICVDGNGNGGIEFENDGARDICLLKVQNPDAYNLRNIRWFPKAACTPQFGENSAAMSLTYLGWQEVTVDQLPRLNRASANTEDVASRRLPDETLQTNHNLLHGNSGGGFFDLQGRLIGLLSGGLGPNNNNSLVALIHPAIPLPEGIECSTEGEGVGQPEPEMSISFSGRHYLFVDRSSPSQNENPVPLSASGIEMRLSFLDGEMPWHSDQVTLNQRENSIIARIFGRPIRSRPDRVTLQLEMRDPLPPARKLVLVINDHALSSQSGNLSTIKDPVTVYDRGRLVENRRKEANDIQVSASKLINQRDTFHPLRTITQTQTSPSELRLLDLSRAYENNRQNPAWVELRDLVRKAQEIRNEAWLHARDIDPFWAAAIRLQQIRFQVIAGQVCGARDEALALMKDIITLTNQGDDPSSSQVADETPRDTRNQSFLVAIRYPLACVLPVSPEDQIKETEELLKALGSLEKPELLHPNRRRILMEMFPLISRLALPRSAQRFSQASANEPQLQEIWNSWRNLVSTWCQSEIPERGVVTEWRDIEKTLGMEKGRPNSRACHGSSL